MSKGLTPKQAAFVRHYCSKDCAGNATEAAARAGYKGSRTTLQTVGKENVRKPLIAEAIAALGMESERSSLVTVEKVLKDLEDTRMRAIEDKRYSAALRASELQGKTMAMFTDRIEQVRSVEDVETDELLGLISELTERLDDSDREDIARRFASDGGQDRLVPGAAGAPAPH